MTEAQIEAVARAYCRRMGLDPDAQHKDWCWKEWEVRIELAHEAYEERAMREALDEVLK